MLPTEIKNKRILFSSLDWGMGHLTRSSELIRILLKQNNHVFFAGNEFQQKFILREFPGIETFYLSGYNLNLSSKKSTYWQLSLQINKLFSAIKNERKWVEKFIRYNNVDVIISDNRYGFYYTSVHNILLTHQLTLELPHFKKAANRKLEKYISNFNEVWVPDQVENSICKNLIRHNLDIPVTSIGLLSQLNKEKAPIIFDYLGIVSGAYPENKRYFDLLCQLQKNSTKKIMIVSPEIWNYDSVDNCVINPDSKKLSELFNASNCIISRAGYTTIMDVLKLEKKAILIPTPGQYEQEYLSANIKHPSIEFQNEKEFIKLVNTGLHN